MEVVLAHARVSVPTITSSKRMYRISKKQVVQLEKNGGYGEAVREFNYFQPNDVKTIRARNGMKKGVSKFAMCS